MRNRYCMIQSQREAASTETKKRGTRIQTKGNEDPNQYLNVEGNVERDAQGNEEGNDEEEASGSHPSAGQKRARGQR
uniref:DUF834 domain-containing protein n=1 Tax=Oryza meridionalis TaxID=40149 RepID=A0A0E0D024_9ORYZ